MKSASSDSFIVVTGAAGFIGSNLVKYLNNKQVTNLILVDHMTKEKKSNLKGLQYLKYYEKDEFLQKIEANSLPKLSAIIHMGACSDTREYDKKYLKENNFDYSKKLFTYCVKHQYRFLYASSGSVYGDGVKGYKEAAKNLIPLNPYGYYKYLFDNWVLSQKKKPPQWVGFRFFNVYGPNEQHKGFMASVILHAFNQIQKTGTIKLFISYKKGIQDGAQKRDFVFVEDVVRVMDFFLSHPKKSGIFNVGTGIARSFNDLARAMFHALKRPSSIEYIVMPESLQEKYQYFTQANMAKLKKIGYNVPFTSLESGVKKYIQISLLKKVDA